MIAAVIFLLLFKEFIFFRENALQPEKKSCFSPEEGINSRSNSDGTSVRGASESEDKLLSGRWRGGRSRKTDTTNSDWMCGRLDVRRCDGQPEAVREVLVHDALCHAAGV